MQCDFFLKLCHDIWINFITTRNFYDLFWDVLIAFISSGIFYYIFESRPQKKQKEHLKDFIGKRSCNIVGDAHAVYEEMKKVADVEISFDAASPQDIEKICRSISPNGPSPSHVYVNERLQPISWVLYLIGRKNRSIGFIQKLFRYINFLDKRHIKLLQEIEDCNYFSFLESLPNIQIKNEDISFMTENFNDYFNRIKLLDQFLKEKKLR